MVVALYSAIRFGSLGRSLLSIDFKKISAIILLLEHNNISAGIMLSGGYTGKYKIA